MLWLKFDFEFLCGVPFLFILYAFSEMQCIDYTGW